MTLKTYAAIMTGALAMLVTALLLWTGTQLPMQDVAAFALMAYYAGLIGTFAVSGWLERRRRKIRSGPTIITLSREEWKERREEAQCLK